MALGLVAIGLFLYFIGTWKQKPKEITDKISEYICVCQIVFMFSISLENQRNQFYSRYI